MKEIYKKILEKAIPYYEQGRKEDVGHVKWIIEIIPKFIIPSDADMDILMPLAILHDVGYSNVKDKDNSLNPDVKKLHAEEGAKIAVKLLNELKYDKYKTKEIRRLILKHDNWIFGDNFEDEPILRIFNNFDFMWLASRKGFAMLSRIIKKSGRDAYERIKEFEEENQERGQKWFKEEIKQHYERLMEERLKDIN